MVENNSNLSPTDNVSTDIIPNFSENVNDDEFLDFERGAYTGNNTTNNAETRLSSELSELVDDFGELGIEAFDEFYTEGVDKPQYYAAFASYYNAGRNGTDISKVKSSYKDLLLQHQKEGAYIAGQLDAKRSGKVANVNDKSYNINTENINEQKNNDEDFLLTGRFMDDGVYVEPVTLMRIQTARMEKYQGGWVAEKHPSKDIVDVDGNLYVITNVSTGRFKPLYLIKEQNNNITNKWEEVSENEGRKDNTRDNEFDVYDVEGESFKEDGNNHIEPSGDRKTQGGNVELDYKSEDISHGRRYQDKSDGYLRGSTQPEIDKNKGKASRELPSKKSYEEKIA